jgi:heme exporter protein B
MIKKLIENIKIVNKENGLIQLLSIYIILGSIIVSMTCDYENIKKFGIFFLVILVPLFVAQISDRILYNDFKDGSLELYITILSSFQIVLNKYLQISLLYITAYIIVIPIILLFFDLSFNDLMLISELIILNIIIAISIAVLIACCNCYFKKVTIINFIIIIPLILPNLIITGLIINDNHNISQLFAILYGIMLIIIPIIFLCSNFLIKNIYNSSFYN